MPTRILAEMNTVMMQRGERIKRARRGKGWTQAKLADKVSMTQAQVSRLEAGRYDPNGGEIRRLSAHLGLAKADLV